MNKQENGIHKHILSIPHVGGGVKYSARAGEMSNHEMQGGHRLVCDSDFQFFRTRGREMWLRDGTSNSHSLGITQTLQNNGRDKAEDGVVSVHTIQSTQFGQV